MKSRLEASDIDEIIKNIKWQRTQDIVLFLNQKGKNLENEFVLDENGLSIKDESDYFKFFFFCK